MQRWHGELLISGNAALKLAGPLEKLPEFFRQCAGGAGSTACSRRVASGDDPFNRMGVEGLVAGGVAQGLGYSGHTDLFAELQDPAHVVAGCSALLFAQPFFELGGDSAQSGELLAEYLAAAALAIKLSLVLGQHVALMAGVPEAMLGDDLVADDDLQLAH